MTSDQDTSRTLRVLVVDDQEAVRRSLAETLEFEGFEVLLAATGAKGLELVREDPSLAAVLLDVKMPGEDGLEILPQLLVARPDLAVILISGHGTIETALEATRRGAYWFLEKPIDRERLLLLLRNAALKTQLAQDNQALRQQADDAWRIVGDSARMRELRQSIERVARTTARVLITGENGTGKELVARNLHLLSPRRTKPWVDLNCAAIPSELLEAELFGHERGAFTGADQMRRGRFELAHTGTLFLDEIGDMPLAAQAKLLRVLQENSLQRVGGAKEIAIDVRVIAATNKDLQEEVRAGRFREDLYYRLAVILIDVPALRERGTDIDALFARFLRDACHRYERPQMSYGSGVSQWLIENPWPGNVRELKNLAERAALLHTGHELTVQGLESLTARVKATRGGGATLFDIDHFEAFRDAAEKQYLELKLAENGWNVKRTAERLGMQRSNLYKKIERHALIRPEGPDQEDDEG